MSLILLDCYCTFIQNVSLAFVSFDFAGKQQLVEFLIVYGDFAFVFSVMLSSCTLISLSFYLLSFIFALSFTQPSVRKGPISVLKKGW